jgi:methylmalonyl-CoA mutase
MSTFPDFSTLSFDDASRPAGSADAAAWRELAGSAADEVFQTPEGIPVKPLYTAEDVAGLTHLEGMPGIAPFVRGPVPHHVRPAALDHPPVRGLLHGRAEQRLLPPQPRGRPEGPQHRVRSRHPPWLRLGQPARLGRRGHGRRGHRLHQGHAHPVRRHPARSDERVHDHERRGAAHPRALHRGGEEQGVPPEKLAGTIQNDILKEFMVRNTYIYPPTPSMRIIADIFRYTSEKMPKFNSISISGYHMQEAGASLDLELGLHAGGRPRVPAHGHRLGPRRGRLRAAPLVLLGHRHQLLHGDRQDAGRAPALGEHREGLRPKSQKSLALRTHCQTSGWSLTAQDVYNNVARTCIEAMAATQGHTQSLHTNSLDEAIALPTDFSARIARNTQLYLQLESGTTRVIDPWGGSYYVERLTHDIATRAWAHIQEVEALGGMTKAIEKGLPKLRIEEAAARTQARIDSGRQVIVGINKHVLEKEGPSRSSRSRTLPCARRRSRA